jgi:hypothetical protein
MEGKAYYSIDEEIKLAAAAAKLPPLRPESRSTDASARVYEPRAADVSNIGLFTDIEGRNADTNKSPPSGIACVVGAMDAHKFGIVDIYHAAIQMPKTAEWEPSCAKFWMDPKGGGGEPILRRHADKAIEPEKAIGDFRDFAGHWQSAIPGEKPLSADVSKSITTQETDDKAITKVTDKKEAAADAKSTATAPSKVKRQVELVSDCPTYDFSAIDRWSAAGALPLNFQIGTRIFSPTKHVIQYCVKLRKKLSKKPYDDIDAGLPLDNALAQLGFKHDHDPINDCIHMYVGCYILCHYETVWTYEYDDKLRLRVERRAFDVKQLRADGIYAGSPKLDPIHASAK